MTNKTCPYCATPHNRPRAVYCSPACKQSAYRRRAALSEGGARAEIAGILADAASVALVSVVAADYIRRALYLYGIDEAQLCADAVFHLLEVCGCLPK